MNKCLVLIEPILPEYHCVMLPRIESVHNKFNGRIISSFCFVHFWVARCVGYYLWLKVSFKIINFVCYIVCLAIFFLVFPFHLIFAGMLANY